MALTESSIALNKSTEVISGELTEVIFEMNEIFLIMYKDGSHIVERYFGLRSKDGETAKEHLKRAIARAFSFCERCRYRFVHCQPFIIDLDEIERRFSAI